MSLSRRTLLAHSAAAVATTALVGCGDKAAVPTAPSSPDMRDAANQLLEQATDLLVTSYPETASSAGIDKGKYAHLKSKLTDRSPAGQAKIEKDVKDMVAKLGKINTSELPADAALNIDVVRTMFETAANGFDFKFGDNAMLNYNWSYRPSPYVVAQNTGAFIEIPSFLDASHQIANADDAEAYLARLESYADQLDGESERILYDGTKGYILPDFLLDNTIGQL